MPDAVKYTRMIQSGRRLGRYLIVTWTFALQLTSDRSASKHRSIRTEPPSRLTEEQWTQMFVPLLFHDRYSCENERKFSELAPSLPRSSIMSRCPSQEMCSSTTLLYVLIRFTTQNLLMRITSSMTLLISSFIVQCQWIVICFIFLCSSRRVLTLLSPFPVSRDFNIRDWDT